MPAISEFRGISIYMYYNDHTPPHFHALYGKYEVLIKITPVGVLKGEFPQKALGLVIEWAHMHQEELMRNWDDARDNKRLQKIAALE